MNFLLITLTLFVLTTFQVRLPAMFGLRLEFLPALVAYGALTFRRGNALLLALVAGFTQDALSAAPFGITALAYGIVALILAGLRDVLDRDLPPLQFAAGALVAAAASMAAFCVLGFSFKIFPVACLAGIVTPVFFFAADYTRFVVKTS
jgi:rod shape-determining protein MreD